MVRAKKVSKLQAARARVVISARMFSRKGHENKPISQYPGGGFDGLASSYAVSSGWDGRGWVSFSTKGNWYHAYNILRVNVDGASLFLSVVTPAAGCVTTQPPSW